MKENYLFYDKNGKPCKQEDATMCVIQYIDASGKVIRETEVEIFDED